MWTILVLFLIIQGILDEVCSADNPDVFSCSGCFAQRWNWASWQCDTRCNVQTSKYGQYLMVEFIE